MAHKSRPAVRRSALIRWVLRTVVWGVGFAGGFLSLYLWYLDDLLARQMQGARWSEPSRLYARPLILRPGDVLSLHQLELELAAAAYRHTQASAGPGSFRVVGGAYVIHSRGFSDANDTHPGVRIRLRLSQGRIAELRQVDGPQLASTLLDPALIARIYPADRRDRQLLSLDQVPPLLVAGLQAVEDRAFKHHGGLAWRGIARAAWQNLRAGEVVQGGSTLTQQLVKSWFLDRERRWLRKFHEASLALLLEARYDKGEILEAYCNEVFWGQQGGVAVHGAVRAAQYYFGQELGQLEPQQIALLVGLLRGPSYYNPWRHPQRALMRRNSILRTFYATGLLARSQVTELSGTALGVRPRPSTRRVAHPAFVDIVRRQLARHIDVRSLSREGLVIHTSLSPWHQARAESALPAELTDIEQRLGISQNSLQAALVVASRESGLMLAAVGDRQVDYDGFNRVLDARRPVGSIIKPFVYLSALASGQYHLASPLLDGPLAHPLADGGIWSPSNFDDVSRGSVTLLAALADSLNQATTRLGLEHGVSRVLDTLRDLGWDGRTDAHPAVLLGALAATPTEVAQWFLSLANDARPTALSAVTAVLSSDGQVMYRYRPQTPVVAGHPQAAYLIRFALQRATAQGTGKSLATYLGSGHGVAGKTGTTDDLRDSWFAGFSEDMVVVAWVGRDDYRPAGVSGAAAALPIVGEFMRQVGWSRLVGTPPPGIENLWVDMPSGSLADASCQSVESIPFARARPVAWLDCARGARPR